MSKGKKVRAMFDAIAPRYDLMNRLMTFGQDQKWRKFVIHKAKEGVPGSALKVLDLATGTGDIAALFKQKWPEMEVVGGDFSQNMLNHAQKRFETLAIEWVTCDANDLPFEDNAFDAVTYGYLLRNVEEVARVLKEIRRVLKSGGMMVCLDTTPPGKSWLYPFIKLHFAMGIPLLGRLIAKDKRAYSYLTESTRGFIPADQLEKAFQLAGFTQTGYKKFMFQTIAVHWGRK
ncbi:MAG: bifunctional demethylmenaquinone methyltransferase/2-methoxy-6-polyprenyl-1,4-benzoquinol methylase UbiE [Acidobacteria bacterium]|nr:MAG: bifunctional demethylmenaquinone methyltransferase/2-methoxy-6-polyprenyl-1,4-benzoquinol methylase UbiE [Acidobacteriota bacterium]